MFCAAIPATLAIGAHANASQKREDRQAEARGETRPAAKVEPKIATGIAVAGLVVASVIYHTQL